MHSITRSIGTTAIVVMGSIILIGCNKSKEDEKFAPKSIPAAQPATASSVQSLPGHSESELKQVQERDDAGAKSIPTK